MNGAVNLNPPDMEASGHVKSSASTFSTLLGKRENDDAVRAPGIVDDRRRGDPVRRAHMAPVRRDLRRVDKLILRA